MRITNSTLANTFLRNLSRNLEHMQTLQIQLSSGKEVSKPSDNPMLLSRIMSIDNNIKMNDQYNTNIQDTIGWVETQDGALSSVSSTLQRVRELIVYGANGSLSDTDRAAIQDEMVQLVGELSQTLNSNFDGRYIFGGQKTTTAPFQVIKNAEGIDILTYQGDHNNLAREIASNVMVDLITDGGKLNTTSGASSAENEDLGSLMGNIIIALRDGDNEALSGDLLGDIDKHIDNILRVRSKVGAIYNRLGAAEERNETENLNLTTLLSQKEDIDIAEKYMEYSVMESVYQASLSAGAKILQPSLLDYIR
ncbi:MAG: flagellar hook-associated protein FlgL [Eubacteriales bacterium]